MGRVLPVPICLQQEQAANAEGSDPTSSDCNLFVLWLPSDRQKQATGHEGLLGPGSSREDAHMRPANDRVLFLGWACLNKLKQASRTTNISIDTSSDVALSQNKGFHASPMQPQQHRAFEAMRCSITRASKPSCVSHVQWTKTHAVAAPRHSSIAASCSPSIHLR